MAIKKFFLDKFPDLGVLHFPTSGQSSRGNNKEARGGGEAAPGQVEAGQGAGYITRPDSDLPRQAPATSG